ncbi:MAG: phosphate ABC transporter permease PstA [Turicibacter sp.]|nr:phosphate ABC transporter permease PstA [Turicibacter sp.]MBQ1786682.1 phosphate ABC transporter permease PstA [Turicibacter sp.]MEE1237444.1 phosphate ABC transporter permease PstA [Turicibacter sp.]
MSRKLKDNLLNGLIWLSAAFSVGILIMIVGFIFANGWSKISWDFLTNDYESHTQYVNVTSEQSYTAPSSLSSEAFFSENLGIAIEPNEEGYEVVWIDENSPVKEAKNNADESFPVKVGYQLEQINGEGGNLKVKPDTNGEDIIEALNASDTLMMKVMSPGGGIFPMIVSTLLLILVALVFSAPIGILAAIYLVEYAKPGKLVNLIRFATEVLSGIPSVVYGLFGMLIFSNTLNLGMSILSGGLTLMILLLPTMMRTTEEALKAVPMSYREASYGLGANKIQTLSKVILPSAIPGILVGVILSIGRTIGESAALLFTIGTFAKLPVNPTSGALSLFETGTSLTVRAYVEVKESGNVEMAAAIGIVILVIVFTLNMISRLISKKFSKANY